MAIATEQKNPKAKENIEELRAKAALFDQLREVMEDAYLGDLMRETERDASISLSRAKKFFTK